MLFLFTFTLLCIAQFLNAEQKIVVDTENGKIEGSVITTKSGFKIDSFLGIPYAEVPERFSRPVPTVAWKGIKKATKLPSPCIQTMIFGDVMKIPNSEDCLYLNLFAPHATHPESSYPVMVFIHGGGYELGSSLEYGQEGITEWIVPKGVIFINFHYRLGIWGFFSTGTSEAKGNYAMWDQSLLLKWVKNNVAHFGGNPNKITVFGESAGSFSTSLQSISPHSRDLFQNAILMSGSAFAPWFFGDETVNISLTVASNVGCASTNSADILKCMRSKSNDELLKGFHQIKHDGVVAYMLSPRIDGDFFPDTTLDKLIQESPHRPTIIGATNDEMGLFVTPTDDRIDNLWRVRNPKAFTINQLRKNMRQIFADRGYSNPCLLTDLAIYHYVDSKGSRDDGIFVTKAWEDFLGDLFFIAPAIKEAHLRRESGSKVWLYLFEYFNSELAPGSYHFYDLWYFFRMMIYRSNEFSADELKVADYYTTLFTNFAKFGDPTKTPVDGVQWQPTDTEFPERCLKINKSLAMNNYFKRPAIAFWNEIVPQMKEKSEIDCNEEESEHFHSKKDEL